MPDQQDLERLFPYNRPAARRRGCLFLMALLAAMAYSAVVGVVLAGGVDYSGSTGEVLLGGAALIAVSIGAYLAVTLAPGENSGSDWVLLMGALCILPVALMMAIAGGLTYLLLA